MHSIERKHKRQLANNLVLLAPLGTRTHTRTRTYTYCTFTCACTHTAHTLKGAFKVTYYGATAPPLLPPLPAAVAGRQPKEVWLLLENGRFRNVEGPGEGP